MLIKTNHTAQYDENISMYGENIIYKSQVPICVGVDVYFTASLANVTQLINGVTYDDDRPNVEFIIFNPDDPTDIRASYITGGLAFRSGANVADMWRTYGIRVPATDLAGLSEVGFKLVSKSMYKPVYLGVDDIEIRMCAPKVPWTVDNPLDLCLGDPFELKVVYDVPDIPPGTKLQASWHKRANSGEIWQKIKTTTSSTLLTFPILEDDFVYTTGFPAQMSDKAQYKVRFSLEGVDMDTDGCAIETEVLVVNIGVCGALTARRSGRWSDPETWASFDTPAMGDSVIIPAGVIVYTGSTSQSFGGRAYGPGADQIAGIMGTDWMVGQPESGLIYNRIPGRGLIVLSAHVTIEDGGALLIGHNTAHGGQNNTNDTLVFGQIKVLAFPTSPITKPSNVGVFGINFYTPALCGLNIMEGGPTVGVVSKTGTLTAPDDMYPNNLDFLDNTFKAYSILNDGYVWTRGRVTTSSLQLGYTPALNEWSMLVNLREMWIDGGTFEFVSDRLINGAILPDDTQKNGLFVANNAAEISGSSIQNLYIPLSATSFAGATGVFELNGSSSVTLTGNFDNSHPRYNATFINAVYDEGERILNMYNSTEMHVQYMTNGNGGAVSLWDGSHLYATDGIFNANLGSFDGSSIFTLNDYSTVEAEFFQNNGAGYIGGTTNTNGSFGYLIVQDNSLLMVNYLYNTSPSVGSYVPLPYPYYNVSLRDDAQIVVSELLNIYEYQVRQMGSGSIFTVKGDVHI